jgi:hypothetical protein
MDSSMIMTKKNKDIKLSDKKLAEVYENLCRSIGLKEGQNVIERISEMYLAPLGFESIKEALDYMDRIKSEANGRNIKEFDISGGKMKLEPGDYMKGVKLEYIDEILENGAMAREYLGVSSYSDSTPFDSDGIILSSNDADKDFNTNFSESGTGNYGDVILVLKNIKENPEFIETSQENPASYGIAPKSLPKFEFFKTPVIDSERHYGIRTGFPSNMIDYIAIKDEVKNDKTKLSRLFFEISRNGFYIPVTDEGGSILFTPAMHESISSIFHSKLPFKKDDLERVFNSGDFKVDNIISLFEEDPFWRDYFQNDTGVSEGYTLKQHTLMVLGQFEKYFSAKELPSCVDHNFFRVVLALHDIGKPQAIQLENDKSKQHNYSAPLANSILERLGYGYKERKIAASLLSGDPLGEYIIGNKHLHEAANDISDMANGAEVPVKDFLEILTIYYQVDAGSYTADAGGLPSLDSNFVFDPANKELRFSENNRIKMEELEKELSRRN